MWKCIGYFSSVLFLTCPSYICSNDILILFLLDFVWMFIFWRELRSTGNKYSLIEYFFHFLTAVLSFWPVHTFPHSHCFFFFFTPVSLKTNPRLLQYNLYHLTYMGRDISLSFPLTLVPRLSLSYKSALFFLPLPILSAVPQFGGRVPAC